MSTSDFGLSNPYLKTGAALVLVALAAIACTSFFSTDTALRATVRDLGALSLLSGTVVYILGRVVQARRSRG